MLHLFIVAEPVLTRTLLATRDHKHVTVTTTNVSTVMLFTYVKPPNVHSTWVEWRLLITHVTKSLNSEDDTLRTKLNFSSWYKKSKSTMMWDFY